MTRLEAGGATDVGRVRKMNEDRFLIADGLYAVADGVGGHQAGEVASQTSIETLGEAFTEPTTEGLIAAIKEANEAVWQLAQDNAEKRGMGTTITACALVHDSREDELAVVNVGDSRAYLFQNGELVQISEDHSLVEELVREGQITRDEAHVHPQRSIITRALGMEPELEVDYWQLVPYAGDRILLCSDGLTNEVTDARIAATLRQLADPQEAARDLVRQARDHGGNDNITVVVVDVVDDGGRAADASSKVPAAAPKAADQDRDRSPANRSDADNQNAGDSSTVMSRPVPSPAAPRRDERSNPAPAEPRPKRFTWRVGVFFATLATIVVVVVAAINWYANNTYYVGLVSRADNGVAQEHVAIYKGHPGGFLWFKPKLVDTKTLTVADILPSRVNDLRAGKEESSKADADRYANCILQEGAAAGRTTTTTTAPPPVTAAPEPGDVQTQAPAPTIAPTVAPTTPTTQAFNCSG